MVLLPNKDFLCHWEPFGEQRLGMMRSTQIKPDLHSPGSNTVVQPLLNIDAFYDAFAIQEGDNMYISPEDIKSYLKNIKADDKSVICLIQYFSVHFVLMRVQLLYFLCSVLDKKSIESTEQR